MSNKYKKTGCYLIFKITLNFDHPALHSQKVKESNEDEEWHTPGQIKSKFETI